MNIVDKSFKTKPQKDNDINPVSEKNKTGETDFAHLKRELPKEVRSKIADLKKKFGYVKEEAIYNLIKKYEFNYNLVEQELRFTSIAKRDVPTHTIGPNRQLAKSPQISKSMFNSKLIEKSKEIVRPTFTNGFNGVNKSLNTIDVAKRLKSYDQINPDANTELDLNNYKDRKFNPQSAKNKKPSKPCTTYTITKTSKRNVYKSNDIDRINNSRANTYLTNRNTKATKPKNIINEKPQAFKNIGLNVYSAINDIKLSNVIPDNYDNETDRCEITLYKEDENRLCSPSDKQEHVNLEEVNKVVNLIVRKLRTQAMFCVQLLRANAIKKNDLSPKNTKEEEVIEQNFDNDVNHCENDKQNLIAYRKAPYGHDNVNNPNNTSRTSKIDMMLKIKLEPEDEKLKSDREKQLERKIEELVDIIKEMQGNFNEMETALKEKDRQLDIAKISMADNSYCVIPYNTKKECNQPLDLNSSSRCKVQRRGSQTNSKQHS